MPFDEKQFNDWIKLREESIDEHNEKLCYCGHTYKCSCSNPDIELFNDALRRKVIILGDNNNGWKIDNENGI